MEWLWLILAGMMKALRDRTLWGSHADDGVELFFERWGWYEKWRDTDARLLWVPLDAWHCFDMAGVFFAVYAFTDLASAVIGTVILLTVFTVFYHGLLLASPLSGVREWLRRYLR